MEGLVRGHRVQTLAFTLPAAVLCVAVRFRSAAWLKRPEALEVCVYIGTVSQDQGQSGGGGTDMDRNAVTVVLLRCSTPRRPRSAHRA